MQPTFIVHAKYSVYFYNRVLTEKVIMFICIHSSRLVATKYNKTEHKNIQGGPKK